MTFGLTEAGYTAPTMADYLLTIRTSLNARLAALGVVEPPDYTRDRFYGQITEVMADQLAQLAQASQAVYDARHLPNATGIQLDGLSLLVGVPRIEATKSTITLRCTGTDGAVIVEGKVVEGGGEFGTARWAAAESGTIGSVTTGYADLEFEAQEPGETIATAGQIDTAAGDGQIVTPVTGWASATNLAAANPGRERETDAALRARRQRAVFALGSTSTAAILGTLLLLEFVTSATVVDNITGTTATIDGISIDPYAVACVVAPSTLTTSQQETVAKTIFSKLGAATATSGAITANITKSDGRTHPIKFSLATDAGVTIVYTLTMQAGFTVSDVEEALKDLVEEYFTTLQLGATIYPLALCNLAASLTGVNDATVTINGGSTPVTHTAVQQPVLTSVTVS